MVLHLPENENLAKTNIKRVLFEDLSFAFTSTMPSKRNQFHGGVLWQLHDKFEQKTP